MFTLIGRIIKEELLTKYNKGFSGSGTFFVENPSKLNYRCGYGFYTDTPAAPATFLPHVKWGKEEADLLRRSFESAQAEPPP